MSNKIAQVFKANKGVYSSQREYYAKTYANNEKEPWDGAFDASWLVNTLKACGPADGKTALDIGAGKGRGAAILAREGYISVAADYLFAPLLHIQKNKKKAPFAVNADIFQAPFSESSFSLVLDWGVFHHILRRDAAQYIEVVKNLLKPGGYFLLGCFSVKFKHNSSEKRKRNWTRHHGHYDRFSTKKELLATFKPTFAIGKIDHDPKGFWLISMRLK